ncbi:hypothetical protein [Agrococcus casei]|uniref:hypothetical protein n=1 Tax=Agrococcus casei TaxID=343512 RepID=UPI000B3530AD|nr:hypothetical protein [Agrococcus casei]
MTSTIISDIVIPTPVVNRHLCREYPVSLAQLEDALKSFTSLTFEEAYDAASSMFDGEQTVESVTIFQELIQEDWFPGYPNVIGSERLFLFLDVVVSDSTDHFLWKNKLTHSEVTEADDVSQFHYLSKLVDDRTSFKEENGNTVVRHGYDATEAS